MAMNSYQDEKMDSLAAEKKRRPIEEAMKAAGSIAAEVEKLIVELGERLGPVLSAQPSGVDRPIIHDRPGSSHIAGAFANLEQELHKDAERLRDLLRTLEI